VADGEARKASAKSRGSCDASKNKGEGTLSRPDLFACPKVSYAQLAECNVKKAKFSQHVNLSELSSILGVSHQRIGQLAKSGKLVRRVDGLFNLTEKTNAAYLASRRKPGGIVTETPLPTTASAGPLPLPPTADMPRPEAERRKAVESWRKLQLANARASGELVERERIVALVSKIAAILSAELLSLPARESPSLAAASRGAESDIAGTAAVQATLDREAYRIAQHTITTAKTFLASLYSDTTKAGGPVVVSTVLDELRVIIERAAGEAREKESHNG
jgi:hypothetical protein